MEGLKFALILPTVIFTVWFVIATKGSPENTCESSQSEDGCTFLREKSHYRAAVVEFKPFAIGNQSPQEAVLRNIRAYVELMRNASDKNVDIIVFPEYGITTLGLPPDRKRAREFFLQLPAIGTIPCNDKKHSSGNHSEGQALIELSCAAKTYQMYLVVNLGEYETCQEDDDSECPSDGAYNYNTNVVFDRNGAIIARYRKFQLYFEPQFNYPPLEYVTFSTDFGVEFGLFTCFDIIFAHPAVELVAMKGIRNFAFPTAWVDELPFLMAIQAQSLWAQSNGVNLLASGYHQPDRGSMGSGIFSGNQIVDYVFDSASGTKLLIGDVPIIPNLEKDGNCRDKNPKEDFQSGATESHFWLREDLSNCTHKTVNPSSTSEFLCHDNRFCCDIEYDLVNKEYEGELKLLVFDGRRTVAAKRDWFEWQLCSVIHCLNSTIESCTEISDSMENINHPTFRMLTLKARPLKLEYERNGASRPALSLLDTQFRLIPPSYFHVETWKSEEENNVVLMSAKSKDNCGLETINVKTIALIQRVYNGRELHGL